MSPESDGIGGNTAQPYLHLVRTARVRFAKACTNRRRLLRRPRRTGWTVSGSARGRRSTTRTRLAPALAEQVVQARHAHPRWGAAQIAGPGWARKQPDVPWPAPSTIGTLLTRHGLVAPRRG